MQSTTQPIEPSTTPYSVKGIMADDLESVWKEAQPFIESALDPSMSIVDVCTSLLKRKMQLWCIFNGDMVSAITTETIHYPQKKVVRIVHCGGTDLELWVGDFLKIVEEWGKSLGMESVEIIGRRGWVRALNKYGYGETHTIVEKEL